MSKIGQEVFELDVALVWKLCITSGIFGYRFSTSIVSLFCENFSFSLYCVCGLAGTDLVAVPG